MIKRNLPKAIISSIITLLPILVGLLLWDSLPEVITTHFGINGEPDGFSGKGFAVFFIPLFMLAMHWFCLGITAVIDGKEAKQSDKIYGLMFFICPTLSLVTSGWLYAIALGFEFNIGVLLSIILGAMFVLIGNYMPKAKRNRTFGVKIKWTLENDENWAATHRFAGRIWFFGGFVLILTALIPAKLHFFVFLPLMLLLALAPMVYSYVYYRGQLASGEIKKGEANDSLNKKRDKIIGISVSVFLVILLSALAVIFFTGNIVATVGEDSFSLEATYYDGISLKYDEIDSIEYRESGELGVKAFGFDSARLALGIFKNEELGSYTRYSYRAPEAYILIKSGDKTLVVGLESDAETKALYDELVSKKGK